MGRFLAAGVTGGLIAGFALALLQAFFTTPLILEAEVFEQGGGTVASLSFGRFAGTLLASLVIGCGYGLLLSAGMGLLGRDRPWRGLLWGLGGYLAWSLWPALGLPPELPGSEAAPLAARQLWWLATALSASLALILLAYGKSWAWRGLALALLAAPQLLGAPQPEEVGGLAPAVLAERFVWIALLVAAAFWLLLGLCVGHFLHRWARPADAETR